MLALSFYVWILPNISQIMKNYEPVCESFGKEEEMDGSVIVDKYLTWSPTIRWAISLSLITVIAVLGITKMNAFIYFNF